MSQFESLQSLTQRLNKLSEKLTNSKLNQEELDEFAALSQQLYERAVILSYKAKEEAVYQKNGDDKAPKEADIPQQEPESIKVEEETQIDTQEKIQPKKEDGVLFDFSDGFDISSEEKQPEKQVERVEVVEETKIQEEVAVQIDEGKQKSFYQSFLSAYNEANKDKLSNAKISSLKGAFGLNDKLLFIRELFHENADTFQEIVNSLDQQSNHEAALAKLSEVAIQKNWSDDSKVVDEFVHLIIRRYVD